jgi:C4-dicarboxylate-specific signal transduction histidine kinase
LQKAQTEPAHVARVMTLGELTASISHEVNQPCRRSKRPGLPAITRLRQDEMRAAVKRIVKDANRVSEVI